MKKTWVGMYSFRGNEVGTVEATYETAQPFRPGRTKFFCRKCGEIWGTVNFPLAEQAWHVAFVPCERCGGGCLSNEWRNNKFEYALSREVLQHDFCCMFDWWDSNFSVPNPPVPIKSIGVELGGGLKKWF